LIGGRMLESFRRLFAARAEGRDFSAVDEWATRRGHVFKRVRGEDGFVIDGRLEGKPWRIEWGLPQRSYMAGHEMRLRMELALRSDTQMLILSLPLMEALDRQTFEEFTDSVQTQIGTKTPEEMRWLVMFPKVDLAALKNFRAHFGAVASAPAVGLAWIEGALANALEEATGGLLKAAPPLVLMTLRGRAYMRLQLDEPRVVDLAAALAIFETAVAQALRAGGDPADRSADWSSTASTAWQSLKPDDDPRRRR
jgi:hypothetical protein